MKRTRAHTIIPAIVMTTAAAVPVVTTFEILSQSASAQPSPGIASAPIAAGRPATARASGGSGTYTGPSVSDPFGNVQASVTVTGKRVVDVAITAPMDNPRSSSINSQAIPLLRQETLQAQSAHVNVISGATYTSQAYLQSLHGAMAQTSLGGATSASAAAGNPTTRGSQPAVTGVSGGDD